MSWMTVASVTPSEGSTGYDILRAVNGEGRSPSSSRAKPDDGAVSSVGVSAGLRVPGGNIPVTVDGTRVCALFFGTVRAW